MKKKRKKKNPLPPPDPSAPAKSDNDDDQKDTPQMKAWMLQIGLISRVNLLTDSFVGSRRQREQCERDMPSNQKYRPHSQRRDGRQWDKISAGVASWSPHLKKREPACRISHGSVNYSLTDPGACAKSFWTLRKEAVLVNFLYFF